MITIKNNNSIDIENTIHDDSSQRAGRRHKATQHEHHPYSSAITTSGSGKLS
eukprot:jgi/Mesvir1/18276/Mv26549-RA.1